jgi:hypothetical protein
MGDISDVAFDNKSLAPKILDTLKTLTRERRSLHIKNDSIRYALIFYSGAVCYYADNDRAAIKYVRRGIRIDRNNHQNYHLLGMSLAAMADDSEDERERARLNRKAMRMYEKAIKVFPRTPKYARGTRLDYPPSVHRDIAALHLSMGQESDRESDRERHFTLAVENYKKVAGGYDWRLWTSRFHSNYALALALLSRYSTGTQAVRDSLFALSRERSGAIFSNKDWKKRNFDDYYYMAKVQIEQADVIHAANREDAEILFRRSVANIDSASELAENHPDSLTRAKQLKKVSLVRERIDSIKKTILPDL